MALGSDCPFCSRSVSGGELFERIIDEDFELTERECIQYMRQISEGVEYIHKQGIVHLDLKPENIMCVNKTGTRIKLIDFGLARKLGKATRLSCAHSHAVTVAVFVTHTGHWRECTGLELKSETVGAAEARVLPQAPLDLTSSCYPLSVKWVNSSPHVIELWGGAGGASGALIQVR